MRILLQEGVVVDVVARHPWLGQVRRYGEDQLLATIDIDPAIRPARLNGETDAEVLIPAAPDLSGYALDAVLAQAVERIGAALADMDAIKSCVLEHAPSELHYDYPEVAETPLEERLFPESSTVMPSAEMEISFAFGDSDTLVVQLDAHGRGQNLYVDR